MMDRRQLAEAVRDAAMEVQECDIRDGPLRRVVKIKSEFDCRHGCVHGSPDCRPGAPGYHGQCARIINFWVSMDGAGGVSAEMFTPICVEDSQTERLLDIWLPLGAVDMHYVTPPEYLRDLGWVQPECKLTGGECWSDGTMLQADKTVEMFLSGGAPAVWSWLAETRLPGLVGSA